MSKYRSKYCDKEVSASQYIAELICENIAAQEEGALTIQFWKEKEWKKIFGWQVVLASRLLKKHEAYVIIKALRTYKGKKAISLKADWILKPLFKKFEKKDIIQATTQIKPMDITKKPRRPKGKKNIIEILGEL